ncbi:MULTISPECIES: hypothetical protein [unclassified Clostridium]|uniref:hypothetical protein n=1 Tax=unclassified Clostridium TaxID=2614128 RepID=UPI000303C6EB|nr:MULTISPECIES: hypothetical protein [unclassified Clostridium]
MGRYTTGYNTSNFILDDWANYIISLVNRVQLESKGNSNWENLFRKYIILGILLGQGLNPKEAVEQIEEWNKIEADNARKNFGYLF